MAEAEHTASAIETDARATAERLKDTARSNGDALVDRAREQGRAIVDEAQETRKKILSDLLVRRKTLHVQIEQLRAARDSLSSSVQSLRTTVEATLGELEGSDERAKQAAIELLRSKPAPPPMGEEALEHPASDHPSGGAPAAGDADDPDAVEEIFAKLRKATLEERGAEEAPRATPRPTIRPDTPVSAILQRRDEVVAASRDALVRKVKRSLQDDQNAALERVRGTEGAAVAAHLGSEREQRDRYALASVEPLRDAANAGRSFAASEGGVVGPELADARLAELAEDLAATLVTALRKRLSNDNGKDGTERVSSAYRDWRGARTERLCSDFSLQAFHAGVAAASSGHPVRYVVAPAEPPCEQCAAVGVSYLTGADPATVRLPPLHAGCRCTRASRVAGTGAPRIPRRLPPVRSSADMTQVRTSRPRRRIILLSHRRAPRDLRDLAQVALGALCDSLWYSSIHQHDVFSTVLTTKIGLFLTFGLVFFLAMWGNLLLCNRLGPSELFLDAPEDELVRRFQGAVRPYAGRLYALLSRSCSR